MDDGAAELDKQESVIVELETELDEQESVIVERQLELQQEMDRLADALYRLNLRQIAAND